jgi:hypothetical protein
MGGSAINTHETLVRADAVKGSSDRTFGLVFAVFFAAVGLLPLLRRHPMRPWALAAGLLFLAVAVFWPGLLRPLNRLWLKLGLLLHAVTNPIILGVLFFLVFTPFAMILRLLRKDLLRLRWDRQAITYWLARVPPGPPPESMRNQF